MSDAGGPRRDERGTHSRISRAPVYVTVGGLALALALVYLAARAAQAPAPAVDVARPGTDRAPRDVNVILRDYRFNPTPLPLVRGETVRFNLINGGLEPHEFVLGPPRVQDAWAAAHAAATPPAAFATRPPASVGTEIGGLRVLLASGEQASVVYRVPNDDQLALACHLPGHVAQGMVGRVELRASVGEQRGSP